MWIGNGMMGGIDTESDEYVSGLATPIMYLDFDGVLNGISYERRTRHTSEDNKKYFKLDKRSRLTTFGRQFPIAWSSELARKLKHLQVRGDVKVSWLSTWMPDTNKLDRMLHWDGLTTTEQWYDVNTRDGIITGKLQTIKDRLILESKNAIPTPIIWIDDELCDELSLADIIQTMPVRNELRLLMIKPDIQRGINRRQFDLIKQFIDDPKSFNMVTADINPRLPVQGR